MALRGQFGALFRALHRRRGRSGLPRPEAGLLADLPWIRFGGLLLGLGLFFGAAWIAALGLSLLLSGGLGLAWSRFALKRVSVERRLGTARVFAGESVSYEIRLHNDKVLPLAWLRLRDQVPEGLGYPGAALERSGEARRLNMLHLTALGPYQRMTWRYTLDCPRRGHYRFGPARLHSGDLFGLFETEREDPSVITLVVYPQVRRLTELGIPAGEPFGGRRVDRVLNRDPLRPIGMRDYQPGDRLRDVHWKATARRPQGPLQVKVIEPVSRPAVFLVLDINTQPHVALGVDPVMQERLIAVAASMAVDAVEGGYPFGLAANGIVPGQGRPIRMPIAQGPACLSGALEALAAIGAYVRLPLHRLLASEARRAPWGASLVVLSSVVGEPLQQELLRLARSGRRVTLVSLDAPERKAPRGVGFHHIPPEALDFAAPGGMPSLAADGLSP
jgi:uncharacterized protein (DUF58 family)